MYIGIDYSPANTVENEVFTYDWVNDLAEGELPTGTTCALEVSPQSLGTDPSPSSHLIGSATTTGTVASQRIFGLLPNVLYIIEWTATTTLANTKFAYSHIPGDQIT